MKTFLFTWNPNKWQWETLSNDINRIKSSGPIIEGWSIKSHKMVNIGDRAFFMKLGKDNPKGIFASGHVISNSFTGPHWDGSGKQDIKVNIEIDVLLDPDHSTILDLSLLQSDPILSKNNWTPQSSGMPINDKLNSKLENLWFNIVNTKSNLKNYNQGNFCSTNVFSEGKVFQRSGNSYERNPHARKTCLDHYGYSCSVCNMNFEELYGKIGKGFIHVHHLNPVSQKGGEYIVNPINDLRPVCPNCHAMVHKKNPPYSIDEMIELIQNKLF